MCGYFSRPIISDIKQPSVLQPSQIAFITWDPDKKVETVTVQPRFEGSVFDFNSLVAIVVYALIAWVLVKIVWMTLADSRTGVRTTSSQFDTRAR